MGMFKLEKLVPPQVKCFNVRNGAPCQLTLRWDVHKTQTTQFRGLRSWKDTMQDPQGTLDEGPQNLTKAARDNAQQTEQSTGHKPIDTPSIGGTQFHNLWQDHPFYWPLCVSIDSQQHGPLINRLLVAWVIDLAPTKTTASDCLLGVFQVNSPIAFWHLSMIFQCVQVVLIQF